MSVYTTQGPSDASYHHRHRRQHLSSLSPQSETTVEEPETYLKLQTTTLSPTPHHPKVVVMLQVPFPLPDVSLGGDCTDGYQTECGVNSSIATTFEWSERWIRR